jgi:hypothetical protein
VGLGGRKGEKMNEGEKLLRKEAERQIQVGIQLLSETLHTNERIQMQLIELLELDPENPEWRIQWDKAEKDRLDIEQALERKKRELIEVQERSLDSAILA